MAGLFDDPADYVPVYEPDFPVEVTAGDTSGGDSPADTGSLPGTSGVLTGWVDRISTMGGKAIDAYSSYAKLATQKAAIDTVRANSAAAQDRARLQAQIDSAKLGFQGKAETTRAATGALQAQQGYQAAALVGSPLVLVAIGVGLFLYFRR